MASSIIRTLGCFRSARARQRSCRWPWERLLPDSVTVEERLRKIFLLVIGVDAPDGISNSTALPGVAGLEAVRGVDGLVVEVGAPINWTRRSAVNMSSSVKRLKGSRLLRIVPVNNVGS